MKTVLALLALASFTVAQGLQAPRWYSEPPDTETTTLITYTTTTYCPVTSTKVESGTTSIYTDVSTSVYTVTSCVGGCGGVVTIPGPTGVASTTTEVIITYTTTCPVESTITAPGTTYTKTFTTTSVVRTGISCSYNHLCYSTRTRFNNHVRSLECAYNKQTDVVNSAQTEVFETITSLCPVTQTTYISGKLETVTFTTTSLIYTHRKTTVQDTITRPPSTTTVATGVYQTITSLCTVTDTTTIDSKEVTVTYRPMSSLLSPNLLELQRTMRYSYGSIQEANRFYRVGTEVYQTITSLCPVTEVKTISGHEYTSTYTSTRYIVTQVPSTVEIVTSVPGGTTLVETDVYVTSTSYCPVTEVKTISGHEYTSTYTSTRYIVTQVPSTVEIVTSVPGGTTLVETDVYMTSTSYCPVTEVSTICEYSSSSSSVKAANDKQLVFTSTILTEVKVPTTIKIYTTAQATEYKTTDVYTTTTDLEAVYTTISAGSTNVYTVTEKSIIKATSAYTLTSILAAPTSEVIVYAPTTVANTIQETAIVTIPNVKTVTLQTTYYANTTFTVHSSVLGAPSTVTVLPPSTITQATTASVIASSAPLEVSANAAATNKPVALVFAGAVALWAFA
ncbi:repetitive proline-rich cell wall protein [Rutstroemia sp. NJR-2017a WRK4]|nr:repetitive proline-rich cell wall protein [Rutstroemia sp. NJR-2017a WRK4]